MTTQLCVQLSWLCQLVKMHNFTNNKFTLNMTYLSTLTVLVQVTVVRPLSACRTSTNSPPGQGPGHSGHVQQVFVVGGHQLGCVGWRGDRGVHWVHHQLLIHQ